MMYKWDIDEAIRIVKDEKITVLMGAPVMLLELLKNEQFGHEHARFDQCQCRRRRDTRITLRALRDQNRLCNVWRRLGHD